MFLRYWDCKLEINAPALEYLYCRGCSIEDILLGNLSNLFEADVTVDHDASKDYGKKIRDFIGALSNVKSLLLVSNLTECLCYATETDLPMFHNLACLSVHIGSILWDVLPNLLHRASNLAVLVFNTEKVERCNILPSL